MYGLFLPMLLLCPCLTLKAQDEHEAEAWVSYTTSTRLSSKWAVWNDLQFATQAFFIARTGMTYMPRPHLQATAGYAWVSTATPFSERLIRDEHRPWAQVVTRFAFGKIQTTWRVRYDMRFREQISGGQVLDQHVLSHRIRLMNNLRFPLKQLSEDRRLHFDTMNELLLHADWRFPHGMDQNRSFLLLGLTKKQFTILCGYYLRFIPHQAQPDTYRHGLALWVNQQF